jgi:hypothetical protein
VGVSWMSVTSSANSMSLHGRRKAGVIFWRCCSTVGWSRGDRSSIRASKRIGDGGPPCITPDRSGNGWVCVWVLRDAVTPWYMCESVLRRYGGSLKCVCRRWNRDIR